MIYYLSPGQDTDRQPPAQTGVQQQRWMRFHPGPTQRDAVIVKTEPSPPALEELPRQPPPTDSRLEVRPALPHPQATDGVPANAGP